MKINDDKYKRIKSILDYFSEIYDIRDHGTWIIRSIPDETNGVIELGRYTGILMDIIDHITSDSYVGFYDGVRFGNIHKDGSIVINGDTLLKRNELEKKKEFLENELCEINKKLEALV